VGPQLPYQRQLEILLPLQKFERATGGALEYRASRSRAVLLTRLAQVVAEASVASGRQQMSHTSPKIHSPVRAQSVCTFCSHWRGM
jgi:hypothetical protein